MSIMWVPCPCIAVAFGQMRQKYKIYCPMLTTAQQTMYEESITFLGKQTHECGIKRCLQELNSQRMRERTHSRQKLTRS